LGKVTSVKPIRVLFYEHNTDGTVGGSHYCLLEICRAVDRSRIDPVVVFAQENSLLDAFRATGVSVLLMPPSQVVRFGSGTSVARPMLGVLQSVANAFRTLVLDSLRWAWCLRRQRIDVLHLNNSCGGDHEVVLGALLCRVPVVAHQRGYPQGVGDRERWFARRLRAIVAISTSVQEDLTGQGLAADKVVLIHDGIDPERILAATAAAGGIRAQLGIPADAPVVGVVGNVKAWKGQDTLVRAMPQILRQFPDAYCLIVGSVADRPYRALMQQHIDESGMAARVIFTGYQRHPAACMAQMSVVVHTSTAPEPFGLVVLEGMALGRPVVATAHGGPMDIIVDRKSGYLTPPGDDQALADVLVELLADPALRDRVGSAGRNRLYEAFTAVSSVRALEHVLLDAAGVRNGPGSQFRPTS
jgi:glycosyltransferase involved in cell wall biosynthesis